jgi:hypothetical protein
MSEKKPKKKNAKLDLVKTKSNLKKIERTNVALDELRSKLKELGDISELQDDPELIEQLCIWVENISKLKLKGEEKQGTVIKLLLELYPILNNEKDVNRLKKQIDHICASGLIQKVSDAVVVGSKLCGFLKKCL